MKNFVRATSRVLVLVLLCAVLPAVPARAASVTAAWDGTTIDVSWYDEMATELYISTPEQFMGLAAIVNGIYNHEIANVIGDPACIVDHVDGLEIEDPYHYGGDDFNGKTIYLTADLDMGGVYDPETGLWSGPRYMPIGGQYLMEPGESDTVLSSSFCGTLDGQGHYIRNIYCSRGASAFKQGQSIGLIGRLGLHDNDPEELRPASPMVCNLAITGYIAGNRSIGGIVGKIGQTTEGAVIENCASYAAVLNTDAKGCGGIVGAGWNLGTIRNCFNAGEVSSQYTCPTGGIVGSNEISVENCYSVGTVSALRDNYAMAIGTTNGGMANADNCYWLADSASGGGYYGANKGTVTELSEAEMKEAACKLGDAFTADTGKNNGYPILLWQAENAINPLDPPPAPVVITCTDVADDIWYAPAVDYVMSNGLFDLMGEETFGPDAPMTRLMLAEALYRLEGSPAAEVETLFSDTSAPSVVWAAQNGVVNGRGDGTFAPDANITREEIAVMLMRYAALSGDTSTRGDMSVFTDAASISSWAGAADAMAWAVGEGLINGMGDGTLAPQGTATRAQVAQVLLNLS